MTACKHHPWPSRGPCGDCRIEELEGLVNFGRMAFEASERDLAEKAAECERLIAALSDQRARQADSRQAAHLSEFQDQQLADVPLAAAQAREAKLREALAGLCERILSEPDMSGHLKRIIFKGDGNGHATSDALCAAKAALALSADNSALREICERVAEECRPGAGATLNRLVIDRVLGDEP